MQTLTIEARTHGRVLVDEPADPSTRRLLVAFHGYGENAGDILAEVRRIPGASAWRVAAVQALHRFYARDFQKIVGSWMTREDRDQAIADNLAYVDRVVDLLQESTISMPRGAPPPLGRAAALEDSLSSREPRALASLQALVFAGFSQGVAMAYRAACLGRHKADGVIALGGDIPPEIAGGGAREWPKVLIGAGHADPWYTPVKLEADLASLASLGVSPDVVRYEGGHQWTETFRTAAGSWLAQFD